MPRTAILALVLAMPLLLPAPRPAQGEPPPVMDTVRLEIAVEDWVTTETARVVVAIDAAAPGDSAATARSEMLDAVRQLAPEADWRFVRFERATDAAGLERWRATVEARLPEPALAGLSDRARQASRPGLQLRVAEIDFTPTLAEIEALRARLRTQVYQRAEAELAALNAAFPGRGFRLATIDFQAVAEPPVPLALPRAEMSRAAPAPAMDAGPSPVSVSQKLTVRALVELSALAPTSAAPAPQ